ncbi:hypothetical protein F5B21DRAFT_508537 [Xylaria acuta]|nr:hypothetical protein F5B21DRAFT_508537 [Xylaria acuta]
MVHLLKMISSHIDHGAIVSMMFGVVKNNIDLMNGIVFATKRATTLSAQGEDRTLEMMPQYFHFGNEARGTDPVAEALGSWGKACDLLAKSNGNNADIVKINATMAIAKRYFKTMVNRADLTYLNVFSKMAEADSRVLWSDPPRFLCSTHYMTTRNSQS